jgi:hypothetical protein
MVSEDGQIYANYHNFCLLKHELEIETYDGEGFEKVYIDEFQHQNAFENNG